MKQITGILPALLTPMNDDYTVNYSVQRQLMDMQISDRVSGFYVCGSTGEGFLLTDDERKKVLENVTEHAAGRVPVIAHIGHISPLQAVMLARHARQAGADYVSSVMPLYYPVQFKRVKEHFARLIDAAGLPMIIYVIGRAGVLSFAQMLELSDLSGVYGIKYTSGNLFDFERLKAERPRLKMICGPDELYISFRALGADAAIGSTYNYLGRLYVAMDESMAAGDIEKARALQSCANWLIQRIIKMDTLPCHKYMASLRGVPAGICRPPFGTLAEPEKTDLGNGFNELAHEAVRLGIPIRG